MNTSLSPFPPHRTLCQLSGYFSGKWQDYFDENYLESTERGDFSVYTKNLDPDEEQPVLITHHGAGYSALSFATLTRELLIDNPGVAVIGIDARAHGNSPGDVSDLSVDCLISDFVSVVESIRRKWSAQHHIFLAGHSLGGSIICRVASQELLPGVAGIVVIDIVEEAALSALRSMPAVLARRPSSFATLEDAIFWAVLSRTSHDVESASISIPDQLAEVDGRWVWKVDLIKCNQWWDGWFRGLSQYFVDCPVPRVLVLAEREYLDRTLMIASMQGKFQNTIIRNCGHAVQEDQPNQLAQVISSFINRNMIVIGLNSRQVAPNR